MMIRKMEDYKIAIFLNKLSFENWESTFFSDEVNIMFNSFLDTYQKIFFTRFPSQRIEINNRNKNWITSGIITSCKHKRELYNACRNNNDNQELLTYYKKYSKILSTVIKEAKKLNYADKIKKAPNKNKTIWNTINIESNKTDCSNTIRH